MKAIEGCAAGLGKAARAAGRAFRLPTAVLVPGAALSFAFVAWALAMGLGKDEGMLPVAMASYVLSAYFTVAVCVALAGANVPMRVCTLIRRFSIGGRLLDDDAFRMRLAAVLGLAVDAVWACGNLALGAWSRSVWFVTLGVYYLALAVMRGFVLRGMVRARVGDGARAAAGAVRACGALLICAVPPLGGVVILVMQQEGGFSYPGYLIYAFAAYAFYALVLAIVNFVKWQRRTDPLMAVNARINLAVALVSILSLEVAMLAAFSTGDDADLQVVGPAATGAAVAAALLALGVASLRQARRLRP